MNEPTTSPVFGMKQKEKEPLELTLPKALEEVIDGKKITRVAWTKMGVKDYCFLNGEFLSIYKEETDKIYQWIINDGDLLGIDWIVLE